MTRGNLGSANKKIFKESKDNCTCVSVPLCMRLGEMYGHFRILLPSLHSTNTHDSKIENEFS